VIGWSAGGLYAAACAALIPERLAGVGVVSTRDLATYDFAERPAALEELGDEDRRALELINRVGAEEATRLLLSEKDAMARRLFERPASILDDLETPEGDRWFWANATSRHPWLEAVRESVRQGPVGYVSDWVARLQPWGFRLSDIDIPVDLWHGAQDPLIRRQTMDFAAETIPGARLHVWPDAGHLGVAKHWTQVIQSATGIRERD
jgi:pimeloyl-ACP methyl ester carboxylesterase